MEVKVYPRDEIYDDDWQQRLEYVFVRNAGKLRRAYICSPSGIGELAHIRRAGFIFPYAASKNRSEYIKYSEEPFPCLRKNILPHGPKEFKASKIFLRQGKKRRKANACRAFLTKHEVNFAALNRYVGQFPQCPSAATPEDVIRNVRSARSYMLYALEKMELAASAPHAYLPSVLCDSIPAERALALDFGLKLLERCDILLVCGRRITAGMRGEIRRAAELKMEIRAFDSDVYETIFRIIGCDDGVKANIVLDKDHPLMAHSAPYAGGTPW